MHSSAKPVDGIPNTKPDAEKRSLTVMNAQTGEMVSTGDMNHRFSQQSMSKPTAMALAMKLMGGPNAYRQYVGVEASGRPYNATELLPDGRPFNSSVNAGALATWVLIHAHTPQGKKAFDLYMDEMKTLTGNPNLKVEFFPLPGDSPQTTRVEVGVNGLAVSKTTKVPEAAIDFWELDHDANW